METLSIMLVKTNPKSGKQICLWDICHASKRCDKNVDKKRRELMECQLHDMKKRELQEVVLHLANSKNEILLRQADKVAFPLPTA
eukprot:scaffold692_cov118-Cylindrotheca_fusiformis.AAC.7